MVVAEACVSNVALGSASVTIGAACAIAGIIVALLGILGYRPRWFADAKLLAGLMTLAPIASVVIMERALITRTSPSSSWPTTARHRPQRCSTSRPLAALEGSVLLWVLVCAVMSLRSS